ncbi:hypothetical protein L596_023533 [Steinernema carpocapsae]|uniref:Uncharacterized protein n=1 Tax=Steinernema carpocapsae TaxID=34508 RepID=A0A4U5ME00_STECR|nr:hypothetical protein L596_023533 [Steinernema carpocapsae]
MAVLLSEFQRRTLDSRPHDSVTLRSRIVNRRKKLCSTKPVNNVSRIKPNLNGRFLSSTHFALPSSSSPFPESLEYPLCDFVTIHKSQ